MEAFTKTPNFVFDLMAQLSPAEFKVIMSIVRKTYGFGEGWARVSFSLFVEMTGLTRQGVFNCIESLIATGRIERRQVGTQAFEYRIKPFNSVEQIESVNRSTELNKPFYSVERLEGENNPTVQLSRTKPFNSVDPLKKKEITTNTSSPKSEDAAHPPLPVGSDRQQMFAKLCEIVGWDHKTLDERSRGQVAQTLSTLEKAEPPYTLTDLNDFGAKVWAIDWRWQKNKQRPTLTQVRQEIGKLRAKEFQTNGTGPPATGAEKWRQMFADDPDEPEYLKKMRNGGKA